MRVDCGELVCGAGHGSVAEGVVGEGGDPIAGGIGALAEEVWEHGVECFAALFAAGHFGEELGGASGIGASDAADDSGHVGVGAFAGVVGDGPLDSAFGVLVCPCGEDGVGGESAVCVFLAVGECGGGVDFGPSGEEECVFAEAGFGDAEAAEAGDGVFEFAGGELVDEGEESAVAVDGIFAADDFFEAGAALFWGGEVSGGGGIAAGGVGAAGAA